jgi:uncharacterized protein YrrD
MLSSLPIASVRSGARIGRVSGLIINPDTLHIDAFECQVAGSSSQLLLLPSDIFTLSPRGIVIQDHEHLSEYKDTIRLKPLLNLRYGVIGKHAYVGSKKVGAVEGYAVDSDSLYIIKLYVKPGLLMKLKTAQLTYDRKSVREVTNNKIVFEDTSKVKVASGVPAPSF